MKISVAPAYFQEAANFFREHGTYTKYPLGTYQFDEFWDNETKRCMEGMTYGNLHIPGTYYFYLNYTQIERTNPRNGRKQRDFPMFTDVDLEYFQHLEKARKEQKGVVLVKPRRIGFSYKSAAIIAYEFTFFRDSKCIIGAYQSVLSENTICCKNLIFNSTSIQLSNFFMIVFKMTCKSSYGMKIFSII
jgi:hypothetical protein